MLLRTLCSLCFFLFSSQWDTDQVWPLPCTKCSVRTRPAVSGAGQERGSHQAAGDGQVSHESIVDVPYQAITLRLALGLLIHVILFKICSYTEIIYLRCIQDVSTFITRLYTILKYWVQQFVFNIFFGQKRNSLFKKWILGY